MPDTRAAVRPRTSGGTGLPGPEVAPSARHRRGTGPAAAAGPAVLLAVAAAVYVGGDLLPGPLGPGLGMIALGLAAAVGLYALNRPVLAIGVLLVSTFLLNALKELPVPDPGLVSLSLVVAAGVLGVVRRANRAPSFGSVEGAMALYVLWNIGSALAPHPYGAGGQLEIGESYTPYNFILTGTAMPFVVYVVGRFVLDRASAVRAVIWTVLALYAYSVWVSLAQFYAKSLVWPRYILTDYAPGESWDSRAVGVFSQPVANGLLLIVGFLLSVHLLHQSDTRRWQRVLLGVLAAISLYAVYLTHTRVVWLCFVLAAALIVVLVPRYRRVYASLLAGIAVAVVAGWSTVTSADRGSGGITSSHEIHDRLNMIATALWAIPQRPLFGWGIGTFSQVNTYHHQQWAPDVPWNRGYGIASHLTELGIATELGLIGLALWLAVLVLVARALWRAVHLLPDDGSLVGRDFGKLVAVVAVMWFVIGLTADLRFFVFGGVLVYLLVGTVVGTAEREVARGEMMFHGGSLRR